METQINFKSHMTKNNTFYENFLAHVLSVPVERLHKTSNLLVDTGEIMVYGDEFSREYKLEDAYIILTRFKKKEHVKILEQFKKEFFHG